MSFDLTQVFSNTTLAEIGAKSVNIISMNKVLNKKTGTYIARAVLDNGQTLIRSVTQSGAVIDKIIQIPNFITKEQRNAVIKDLYNNSFTQDAIAAMLDISQATVSRVLKGK